MSIQTADPQQRKKALKLVVMGMVVGCLLFALFQLYEVYVYIALSRIGVAVIQMPSLMVLIVGLISSPIYLSLWMLIRLARKVIEHQRFPPPNTSTVRDVTILEGVAAIRRGKLILALCLFLLVSTLILPFYSWYLVLQVLGST